MDTPPESLKRRKPVSIENSNLTPDESGENFSAATPSAVIKLPAKPQTPRWLPGLITFGIPSLVICLGILAVSIWFNAQPDLSGVKLRLPEPPGAKSAATAATNAITDASTSTTTITASSTNDGATTIASTTGTGAAATTTTTAATTATNLPGLWPNYRGAKFDAISSETTPLATTWPASGPAKLWQVALGEGYAGAAVANGRVYVLDYDQAKKADTLRCLSLADGKQIWATGYAVEVKRNHGMSRTVPAVGGGYVVSLGPKCHVMCCDAKTGAVKWKIDLVKEYGATVPTWYAGQCPIIVGKQVILAPGGKALMIAVDLATGKVAWKSPNPSNWAMTHSSILPMTFGGQKMYVYPFSGGVAGISAANGQILWQTTEWTVSTANIPMPIHIGDGRIFLSGGYNAGAMMIKLAKQGAKFTVQKLWRVEASVFGTDQQTPILYQNNIYGVIPGGELACLDLNGKQRWASGSQHRYGLGAYMLAGGMIYVVDDGGTLSLVKAQPSGFQLLTSAKVLAGPDAWGPMTLVGGRLILRDLKTMVCLDVSRR